MCIYRFLYHCIYIDFYSIVRYLDSMYILTVVIIISSIIYIYFCIMHCIYFRILFTRAPIDSRALRSDGTTLVLGLLFFFFKLRCHRSLKAIKGAMSKVQTIYFRY